jgi:hypothetical protein
MGIDYTAGVFFGTFAKDGSAASKKIEAVLNEAEDEARAVDGAPDVTVRRHGNSWTGEFTYAIHHGETHTLTTRGAGHAGPFAPMTGKEQDIREAMARLGVTPEDFEPIGHYAFQDVW